MDKIHEPPCAHYGIDLRSIRDELMCHFPYAVLSLAFGLVLLSILTANTGAGSSAASTTFYQLFHSCHFMHIVFAAAGTTVAFFKYSRRWILGIVVGAITPAIFCVMSDVIMPYLGGRVLGVPMRLHICFLHDFVNAPIFLGIGILTGLVLTFHTDRAHTDSYISRWLHFGHILLSGLAALFYMVSHGFYAWASQMGLVYLMLTIAVVIPCTISDIVVPMLLAKSGECHEHH